MPRQKRSTRFRAGVSARVALYRTVQGVVVAFALILSCFTMRAATRVKDPGVRGGAPAAGRPLRGTDPFLFAEGRDTFQEVYSVTGVLDPARGLGPRFNGTSCEGCHAHPAVGGSSPRVNPQFTMASAHGARNVLPLFLKPDGPVRVVRINSDSGGGERGRVVPLFTVTGRPDAGSCILKQPDFSESGNVIFRIPTPTFGAGLIENIPDAAILANQTAEAAAKRALGIRGKPNKSGHEAIGRFGWKAQNKSLLVAAAEAYSVEIGVPNEIFSYEGEYGREPLPSACLSLVYGKVPDDPANYTQSIVEWPSYVHRFMVFMRLLDQPKPLTSSPGATAPSTASGRQLFGRVGCALCHTPALKTGRSSQIPALNNVAANLYSDLLLHRMGPGLSDGIVQGAAGPDEFRTAPLWGLGQRIFFLHDGRTSDLLVAIREHKSGTGDLKSEASAVIGRFEALGPREQQDLLDFLRSL